MRNAQLMGQVFIYVMSAMVFALVVVFGYRAISDFIHRADQVAEVELSTDLKSSVTTIASSQDVKQKTVNVPAKFKKICFIDLLYPDPKGSGLCTSTHADYNLIICNFWQSKAEQNVFLLPNPADIKMYVGKIDVGTGGYLCLPIVGGKLKLKLEGLGDKTRISEWPEV